MSFSNHVSKAQEADRANFLNHGPFTHDALLALQNKWEDSGWYVFHDEDCPLALFSDDELAKSVRAWRDGRFPELFDTRLVSRHNISKYSKHQLVIMGRNGDCLSSHMEYLIDSLEPDKIVQVIDFIGELKHK